MKAMAAMLVAGALATNPAVAGAFDECNLRGDQAAVRKCLLDADREAQDQLNKVEGELARKARELDIATGHAAAAPALARSMRDFGAYRKSQCEFVRAMHASGARAEQSQQGCLVDMTRRRIRDLQN